MGDPAQFRIDEMEPAKEVRKHRSQKPQRFLTAAEIRQIIDDTPVDFKTIYLLAINGGWNNSDLRALMVSDLESIEDGVIRFCREKTGIERSTPLWPETLAAIKEWLKLRPVIDTRRAFVECSPIPDGCSDGNSRVSKVFSLSAVAVVLDIFAS